MSAAPDVPLQFERHRAELTRHCVRMLGSAFEAEDAVQETLLRAWRGFDHFEARSGLRAWLYAIATNVCLGMLAASQRRARPTDVIGPETRDARRGRRVEQAIPVEAVPLWSVAEAGDPVDAVLVRESVRLAFVAALEHLPSRQRAVLLLREVLRWRAVEIAELLGTSVPAVNSALQRARATIDARRPTADRHHPPVDQTRRDALAGYVDAFERRDIEALTALLRHEGTVQRLAGRRCS